VASRKTPEMTRCNSDASCPSTQENKNERRSRVQKVQTLVTHLGIMPVSLDTLVLVRDIRQSILRAQKASMCLATDNPDRWYDVNKFKWSTEVCREARRACQFFDQDTHRSRREIEQFCEEMLEIFSTLFSRLALVHRQKSKTQRLTGIMLFDLSTAFLDLGKEGGRLEQLWLEAFTRLRTLIKLTRAPRKSMELLHQILKYRTSPPLARYHLYLYLFDVVHDCYIIDRTTAGEALEWKAVVDHLEEGIPSRLRDDFLRLSKVFAKKAYGWDTTISDPATLITRYVQAKQLVNGYYALAQAEGAAANISTSGVKELKNAIKLYREAHELFKPLDKKQAGLAIAKVGLLRWKFYSIDTRSDTIQYLRAAQKYEKYADQDSQWVKETKKCIAIYEVALEQERLRKKEEERKREEQLQKMRPERQQKLRHQNIEALKEQGEQIHSLKDLLTFSMRLQRDFAPPELCSQEQLQLGILDLKNRKGSRRMNLKKIIRLYHPDKNGTQGEAWKSVCEEVTRVLIQCSSRIDVDSKPRVREARYVAGLSQLLVFRHS